jgi:hypothetical protein
MLYIYIYVFIYFNTFWHYKLLQTRLANSLPQPGVSHFFKVPWLFLLGVLIAIVGPLSEE